MEYVQYLRQQAAEYREQAAGCEDPQIARELASLAVICEEVAGNIEDRQAGG